MFGVSLFLFADADDMMSPEMWAFTFKVTGVIFGIIIASFVCYHLFRYRCPKCWRFGALEATEVVANLRKQMKCRHCGHTVWREIAANVYCKCVNCQKSWPLETTDAAEPNQEIKCKDCGHTAQIIITNRGGGGGCYG